MVVLNTVMSLIVGKKRFSFFVAQNPLQHHANIIHFAGERRSHLITRIQSLGAGEVGGQHTFPHRGVGDHREENIQRYVNRQA